MSYGSETSYSRTPPPVVDGSAARGRNRDPHATAAHIHCNKLVSPRHAQVLSVAAAPAAVLPSRDSLRLLHADRVHARGPRLLLP